MNNKIVKLALILFLVSAIVAAALGLVNGVTADRIKQLQAEKLAKAMQAVLPADSYEPVDYTGSDATVDQIYKAGDQGYVVQVTVSGSQGNITMIVGVDAEGKTTGISITSHSETSGLGAVAASTSEAGQAFRAQFVGKDSVAVTKDGGDIDAISGATITSRAVCNGTNSALEAVKTVG